MNRVLSLIWGAITVLPLGYFFYFMASVSNMQHPMSPQEAEAQFDRIMNLHLLNMLLIFALITSYIVFLFKSDRVPKEKKTLWAVVLFMGNMVSMPIFWFLYVWKKPNATSSS